MVLESVETCWWDVSSGVPRGSILGPLLVEVIMIVNQNNRNSLYHYENIED